MDHPIMTIRDVAEALKVAEKTVYAMASEGEIPAFRVRSQWRIRRIDFEAWLAKQLEKGAEASAPDFKTPVAENTRSELAATEQDQRAEPEALRIEADDAWERLPQEELQHRFVSALGS